MASWDLDMAAPGYGGTESDQIWTIVPFRIKDQSAAGVM